MKINHLIIGLSIVLAFFAGRWYQGNPSVPPAEPSIAGVELMPAPAADKNRSNQSPSARKMPVPLMDKLPVVDYPGLPQTPVLSGKPEVVRNTGPFIDADPGKSITPYVGPDRPVRNAGTYIDAGGPTPANNR